MFNTSLLHDKEYINVVKQEICNTISQYKCNEKSNVGGREFTIDNQMFFEMLKLNIRGQSVTYSSRKAKYNRDKEIKIEQNITNLENNLTGACLSKSQDKIFELEKKLNQIRIKGYTGGKIKSFYTKIKSAILRRRGEGNKIFL